RKNDRHQYLHKRNYGADRLLSHSLSRLRLLSMNIRTGGTTMPVTKITKKPVNAFDNLPAPLKAHALVGRFFQDWAMVENGMNGVIGKALGLELYQQSVVTANLGVSQKLSILTVIVTDSKWLETKQAHYTGVLEKITNLSFKRNIIAHNFYYMNEKGNEIIFS